MVAKYFLTLPAVGQWKCQVSGGLKVKGKYECKPHIGFSRKKEGGGGGEGFKSKEHSVRGVMANSWKNTFCIESYNGKTNPKANYLFLITLL